MKPIEYFIKKRGDRCENCQSLFTFFNVAQRHHCLIRRRKNTPELDNEINIELVCTYCHNSGDVDTFEHRQAFVNVQIERGFDVGEWVRSLTLKYIEDWLLRL
jgi:hypothetical protein